MNEALENVLRVFKANGLTAGRILYPKQLRHHTWPMKAAERRAFDRAVEELLAQGLLEIPDPDMGALALTEAGEAALQELD